MPDDVPFHLVYGHTALFAPRPARQDSVPVAEAPLLRNFARQYRAYVEAGTVLLAILPASPDPEEFPFPVLIDQDRYLTTRLVERWIVSTNSALGSKVLRWRNRRMGESSTPWPKWN